MADLTVKYNTTLNWLDTAPPVQIAKYGIFFLLILVCFFTLDPNLKGYSLVKTEWWVHMTPVWVWMLIMALSYGSFLERVFKPETVLAEVHEDTITLNDDKTTKAYTSTDISKVSVAQGLNGAKIITITDTKGADFELPRISGRIKIIHALESVAAQKIEHIGS